MLVFDVVMLVLVQLLMWIVVEHGVVGMVSIASIVDKVAVVAGVVGVHVVVVVVGIVVVLSIRVDVSGFVIGVFVFVLVL